MALQLSGLGTVPPALLGPSLQTTDNGTSQPPNEIILYNLFSLSLYLSLSLSKYPNDMPDFTYKTNRILMYLSLVGPVSLENPNTVWKYGKNY